MLEIKFLNYKLHNLIYLVLGIKTFPLKKNKQKNVKTFANLTDYIKCQQDE